MKKSMLFGAVTAVTAGVLYKMHKAGKLDKVENDISNLMARTKRDVKNAVAAGQNEIGYVKDRAAYHATKLSEEIKNNHKK